MILRLLCGTVLAALIFPTQTLSRPVTDTERFLEALAGPWQGRAVQTPVGPAPYDIHFQWQGKDCISGTADNSFSHHTWTFCRGQSGLKLDFLSDFRGNDTPIHMKAVARRKEAVVFYAETHPFMEVILSVEQDSAWVDIMHDDKLHVRIQWRRPSR